MSSSSASSLQPPPAGAIGGTSPYSASSSFLPSFMIIAALLAFVFLASVSIHLLLRFLSAVRTSSSSSSSGSPLPRTHRDGEAGSGSAGGAADYSAAAPAAAEGGKKEAAPGDEKQRLIDSLPLFTMASALAALPKSSPDCAVCLSPFTPDAELRLLPACRHAFHAACVDAWLRTTPSCPLCRAAVAPPHPSLAAAMRAAAQQPQRSRGQSGPSFLVEIGTVSNRGSSPAAARGGDGNSRTYSLGSFDYQIDEEVEAVVSRVARIIAARESSTVKEEKPPAEEGSAAAPVPSPPGEAVAEAAGSSRGWLREYVDRLASSAYTFSERWSLRWSQGAQQRQEEPWLWDAEAAGMSAPPGSDDDEEETAFMVMYRWIAGV
ncbi:E3 ubiquitin-protein ligase ATL4-like [Panicum miliaceum]|uniref:E3 ubiquitin-protein ligase ATL4-like n=1 Tax=Panicum miliaceum TaxID=4540 RepID=A0A3L6Q552_PANMI|nr:E3 ubiquitin-protein ligase ATL4-like [Panicum miliaceum]